MLVSGPSRVLLAATITGALACPPSLSFAQTLSAGELISLNDDGLKQLAAQDVEGAERTFKRVVDLASDGKADLALARALNNLGNIELSRGRPAEAIKLCERSSGVFLTLKDNRGIAEAEGNLASAHLALRNHDDAFLYASHVTDLYATLALDASQPDDFTYFLDRFALKIQFLVGVLKDMGQPDLARDYIARARPVVATAGETAIARLELAQASLDEVWRPWRALPVAWRLERFFSTLGLQADAVQANAVLNRSIRPMLFWIAFVLGILSASIDLLNRGSRLRSVVGSAWGFVRRAGRWTVRAARQPVLGQACVMLTWAFLAAEYVYVTDPTLRAVDAASTMLPEWPLPRNLKYLLSDMLANLPHYVWLGFALAVLFFLVWLPLSFLATRWLADGVEWMLNWLIATALNRRNPALLPERVGNALAAQREDSKRQIWITVRAAVVVALALLALGVWDLPSSDRLSVIGLTALVLVESWLALRDYLLIRQLRRLKPYRVYERLYPPGLARGPAIVAALATFGLIFVPLCVRGLFFLQAQFIYQPFDQRAERLANDVFAGARIYHSLNLPGEIALVFASVSQAFEPAKGVQAVSTALKPFLPTLGLAAMVMWVFALVVPFALSLLLKSPRLLLRKLLVAILIAAFGTIVTYLVEPLFAIHTAPATIAFIWMVVVWTILWCLGENVSDAVEDDDAQS